VLKKHKKVYKNNNVKVVSLDAIFPDITLITNGKKEKGYSVYAARHASH
jgi:hypothetical protein